MNLEQITSHYPDFNPEFFVEQTQKIQDIIKDSRFEHWMDLWIIGQSCRNEVNSAQDCIDDIKSIDIRTIIENNSTNFDGLRLDLHKGKFQIESVHYCYSRDKHNYLKVHLI